MGDIVNFYRFRKKRAKKEALSKAGENRASHGRTKNEKQRDLLWGNRSRRADHERVSSLGLLLGPTYSGPGPYRGSDFGL